MGVWAPDAGKAIRYRNSLGRSDLAVLFNISAEFAASMDTRSLADRARSTVFSSLPDAVLVSGQITGEAAKMEELEAVKAVLAVHACVGQYRGETRDCRADICCRGRLYRRILPEGGRRYLERG